jgi:hypothetical protein
MLCQGEERGNGEFNEQTFQFSRSKRILEIIYTTT